MKIPFRNAIFDIRSSGLDDFGGGVERGGFTSGAVMALKTLVHAQGQEREVMTVVGVFEVKDFREAGAGKFILVPRSIGPLGRLKVANAPLHRATRAKAKWSRN